MKSSGGPAYFQGTAGTFPAALTETIGNPADAGAGMLFVEIKHSDGDRGVLVVLCALPGAPPTNSEGSLVAKGTAEYTWWGLLRALRCSTLYPKGEIAKNRFDLYAAMIPSEGSGGLWVCGAVKNH